MVEIISYNRCYTFVKKRTDRHKYYYRLVAKPTSSLEESRRELLSSIKDAEDHGYALLDELGHEIKLICMRPSECLAFTHDLETIINHSHIKYSGYILVVKHGDWGNRETHVIYCENRNEAELNIKQIYNKRYTYEGFSHLYQILRGLEEKNEHSERMTFGVWFDVELYNIEYYKPCGILNSLDLSIINTWELLKFGDVGKIK